MVTCIIELYLYCLSISLFQLVCSWSLALVKAVTARRENCLSVQFLRGYRDVEGCQVSYNGVYKLVSEATVSKDHFMTGEWRELL